MKKIAIAICLLGVCGAVYAQRDSRAEVMADIERAGGTYYLYPMDQPAPTPAPKGYQPFYVSHVGRHGSRFALGSKIYENLLEIWTRGHEKGWLTPQGEAVYEAYTALYPSIARREGNLTHKGQAQHRYIASQIFKNYPAVFKGPTRAEAVSTVSHRVIVSMFSFLRELDALDRDFSYDVDYGQPYQSYLLPDVIDSDADRTEQAGQKFDSFLASILAEGEVDLEAMLGRWISQPDSLLPDTEARLDFCDGMHTFVSSLDNLDVPVPEVFYSLFSPEERYAIWRLDNYGAYALLGRSPDTQNLRVQAMQALWDDFRDKAEADWANGVQLRLRFAHDSTLMPLLSLLDVNGMGARIEDPAQVEQYWRSFDIPMACNLQFIFFKSKKNPDILVQVLLNGREATLPLPVAAPGSFYRWEDVKNL